ncbi:hypothetical protein [Haloarchaeobius litoreus]|uniref:CopG family transcriptional regulator n=1 Tax=Haloarchaeobius litoreus TaxID=755306 RepID=A0ABD6DRG8_9EURY|nr:hypothetical protein [Haloarchaeobius litoreus]
MSDTRDVRLSPSVAARIDDRLPHTEFESVEGYVDYVLTAVLDEVDDDESTGGEDVDEREVRDRLESLGYLES